MTDRPTGPACGNNPNYRMSDGDRQAVEAFQAYLAERAALRDRIAEALYGHDHPSHLVPLHETGMEPAYRESADAVLAVLPPPVDQAAEPPLSPYYEHPECGFRWHGHDGMDIPMRDGQPVCPRCELNKTEKQLAAVQRRRDEVGEESRRRGKTVLEYSEKIRALEREIDGVRRQLGAEILRADQAEDELRRMADETPAAQGPAVDRATVDRALDALRAGNHITARLLLESAMGPTVEARQDGAPS
ncbi:hypothetical protein [Streptomyces sp.]|uniref:hypothetical protein n=1 Tax=Streptomyces sp. TaxID=1931 RepID=UPI002D577B6A|nr:hypothetical protein [Streptomyces sp.]HZF92041.1 hypothetical protein [Streptomyces sp.]